MPFNPGTSTVTFTVTDVHGNINSATTSVNINFLLSSSIPDVYAMNPSTDDKNTIYLGYGPSSLSVNALANGGKLHTVMHGVLVLRHNQ